MTGRFRLEVLNSGHDRTGFASGSAALDRYLQQQATQDMRRHVSACYVAMDEGSGQVAGYYTLAAGGVLLADLPEVLQKKLPRYPSVPVAWVGRLAVDRAFQGRKLGSALLADGVLRAMRSEAAIFALVVDAKDAAAEAFYRHHGFAPFGTKPRQLVVPLSMFKSGS